MTLAHMALWVAYASLAFELLFLAVPSEASTVQILGSRSTDTGPALAALRRESGMRRFLVWALPTIVGVLLFLVPLVATLWPAVLRPLVPIEALTTSPWVAVGILLLALGRTVSLVAVTQVRKKRGTALAVAGLAPDGLFARSRNPGLVGMYLFYLGAALLTPAVGLFAGFALYTWNMHRKVLLEEDTLRHRLGAEYVGYCGRVPRYVGRVRSPR